MNTRSFIRTASILFTFSLVATACTKESPITPSPVHPEVSDGIDRIDPQDAKEPREGSTVLRHRGKNMHYMDQVSGLVSMRPADSDGRVSVTMIPSTAAYTPLPPPDTRLDGHALE